MSAEEDVEECSGWRLELDLRDGFFFRVRIRVFGGLAATAAEEDGMRIAKNTRRPLRLLCQQLLLLVVLTWNLT